MRNVAANVIEICGGIDRVAEITGRSRIQVRKWTYAREKGGTGCLIPAQFQQRLLDATKDFERPLMPEDFFDASEEDAA